MRIKRSYLWGLLLIILLSSVFITSCCPPFCKKPTQVVNCTASGSSSLFVAAFDGDTVGSLPAPTAPLHYGPPGASLVVQGDTNKIAVVDSTVLGSKALMITRGGQFKPTTQVDSVVGDNGTGPHTSGRYYFNFRAHGQDIPQHLIAGTTISVRSLENRLALNMKLFDNSYHLLEGGNYVRLSGAYDPGAAHTVHIELNLDTRRYSVCINGVLVANNKSFLDNDFTNLRSLTFWAPDTITEAFTATYVFDDIRITK